MFQGKSVNESFNRFDFDHCVAPLSKFTVGSSQQIGKLREWTIASIYLVYEVLESQRNPVILRFCVRHYRCLIKKIVFNRS